MEEGLGKSWGVHESGAARNLLTGAACNRLSGWSAVEEEEEALLYYLPSLAASLRRAGQLVTCVGQRIWRASWTCSLPEA